MVEWKVLGTVFYCLISFTVSIIFIAGVLRIDALRVVFTINGV